MILLSRQQKRVTYAIGLTSLLCLVLFITRVVATGTTRYYFIPWNLFLAWVSLGFCLMLLNQLKQHPWLSWQNISLSLLWLVFLPNTWYVLTDFIHIYPNGEISQLYDVVLMSSLVISGFALGFAGLYFIHQELNKRFASKYSSSLVAGILLLSGFAIYLGRDLRWNSWDVLVNPGGIILNVSDRVVDPLGHPSSINVTFLFFVLLSTIYAALWFLLRPVSSPKRRTKRR